MTHGLETAPSSRRRVAAAAGAAVALASVAPIAIGSATLALRWPVEPFNFTLAVFIVVWIAALLRMYCADIKILALAMHADTLASVKQGRSEVKKTAKDLRDEVRRTAHGRDLDEIVESTVQQARPLRSVE
jgi:hypothetical protein